MGHHSRLIWPQRGPSSQVTSFRHGPFSFSQCAHIHAGAIAHPTFLEESHFEKITRTFDPPAPFHRNRLTTPRQVPSSYLARVSGDQDFVFHTGTIEPSPLCSCDRGRLFVPARGTTSCGRYLGPQQVELLLPGVFGCRPWVRCAL